MTAQPRVLTDEVQRALKERAIANQPSPEPALPPVPDGYVRYLVAVGESVSEGIAVPAVVAAILRGQADQLDPPRPKTRSTET